MIFKKASYDPFNIITQIVLIMMRLWIILVGKKWISVKQIPVFFAFSTCCQKNTFLILLQQNKEQVVCSRCVIDDLCI